jgi:hypothetical protein
MKGDQMMIEILKSFSGRQIIVFVFKANSIKRTVKLGIKGYHLLQSSLKTECVINLLKKKCI